MTMALEALEVEALKLPAADRSRLLERLISSLDLDQDVEAAWDAVAESREAELADGAAETVPLEEAIARLESRFPG